MSDTSQKTTTNSSNQQSVITVSKDQLPACCPPKDQAHWNQHPRVYIELDKSGEASCPYCGNRFALTQ